MKGGDFKKVADEILSSHKIWVESDGKLGNKASFMHIDFTGEVFDTELSGASFTNCNLTKVVFKGKMIQNIQLTNCNLSESRFLFNEIKNILVENCNLSFAKFGGIHFDKGVFNKIKAEEVFFTQSFFDGVIFSDCKFSKSNFSSCSLNKIKIENSLLLMCDFAYCNFFGGLFSTTGFKSCDFQSVEFNKTNFNKSDFTSMNANTPTSFSSAKFKSITIKDCTFDKSFNRNQIKQSKRNNLLKRYFQIGVFYLLNIIQFIIVIFSIFALFKYKIDEIKLLSLGVLLSLFVYLNNSNIENYTNNFDFKMKMTIAINYLFSFLMLLGLWQYSLKFENFAVSVSLLTIIFVLSLQSFFVFKKQSIL